MSAQMVMWLFQPIRLQIEITWPNILIYGGQNPECKSFGKLILWEPHVRKWILKHHPVIAHHLQFHGLHQEKFLMSCAIWWEGWLGFSCKMNRCQEFNPEKSWKPEDFWWQVNQLWPPQAPAPVMHLQQRRRDVLMRTTQDENMHDDHCKPQRSFSGPPINKEWLTKLILSSLHFFSWRWK